MHVTLVNIKVKPDCVAAFIAETEKNHLASIQECGNCRFDVLQSSADTTYFVLYEAYESATAAAEHKKTAHYLHWRDAVAPWMAEPRSGAQFNGLFPELVVA